MDHNTGLNVRKLIKRKMMTGGGEGGGEGGEGGEGESNKKLLKLIITNTLIPR